MAEPNFADKTIWTGDNLDILRGMNSECVNLIYLDPPFNSNQDYAAPVGSTAAGAAFKDTWTLSDLDPRSSRTLEISQMSDLERRVNFLEGEVSVLETLMGELLAAMGSHQLIDGDHLMKLIDYRMTSFVIRQHDDLVMGAPGEHYFKGAVRALEIVKKELAKDKE